MVVRRQVGEDGGVEHSGWIAEGAISYGKFRMFEHTGVQRIQCRQTESGASEGSKVEQTCEQVDRGWSLRLGDLQRGIGEEIKNAGRGRRKYRTKVVVCLCGRTGCCSCELVLLLCRSKAVVARQNGSRWSSVD